MFVALREVARAKLRFGLLTGAVGLLVFLILFQQALLGSLLGAFTGALESQSAQLLVLDAEARGQVDASFLDPDAVDVVADLDGVAAAGPWRVRSTAARPADGELLDVVVIGHDPDGPGQPTTVVDGRAVTGPGEAVVPVGYEDDGLAIGAQVELADGAGSVEVVGLAEDAEYLVAPALWVASDTAEDAVLARSPDAPFAPVNAVAVTLTDDADVAAVAAAIEDAVGGTRALTPQEAVDGLPGVDAIGQSFGVILGLAFVVVGLVTGIFFLILTVQKADALTLLRAVGASARDVVTPLVVQVLLVTGGGVLVGLAGLTAVAAGGDVGLSVEVDPVSVAATSAGIVLLGLLASLAAVRRVLRIEPFEATTRGNAGGAL
ncbi:FtsX-like permease family protein [Nitriliruptoraceae bacterium ZYF776]|nr:FtsX-like permease family protein [Profundirhabdus halotolerans]